MAEDSLIGQYARLVVAEGTGPLRKGQALACRVVGLSVLSSSERMSVIRGEVVSNDIDGPLPSDLMGASLIITPADPEVSETRILEGGTFRAKLGFLTLNGEIVATGEGVLLRISDEVPYERPCPGCMGWKMCEDCAGTGGETSLACAYCDGSGVCTRCDGTGAVKEPF
jgi:hypothetical protein